MQFPKSEKLELELTSKCTLFCPNCPRTYQADQRKIWDNGHINHEALIEWLKSTGFTRFQLGGAYGDGIYHPHLVATLRAIKAMGPGHHFNFDTNGSYRSEKDWQAIADLMTRKDCIIFSIDGTPANFTQYRVNADWPSIEKGARIIAKGNGRCRWKYIVFKYNQTFEDMKTAYDTAMDIGFPEFVIVHTHRAEAGQLANKEDFDENLTKLEEYVYNLSPPSMIGRQWAQPKLNVAVTPRTSMFKVKEIIENKEQNVHEKHVSNGKGNDITLLKNKPDNKEIKLNVNKQRRYQWAPTIVKDPIHTEKVSPQCINMKNHSNFISSDGNFLPCCYMRVNQQDHFDHAGITKEDEKSLSIYNNTFDEIIEGVAIKKIMSNFDNIELCTRQCKKAKAI